MPRGICQGFVKYIAPGVSPLHLQIDKSPPPGALH